MKKQITTLLELKEARDNKRAVFTPGVHCFKKPCPAAFVINYTGEILLRLFTSGMFIYEKGN